MLEGNDRIELTNQNSDRFSIGGNALLRSSSISVGQDGEDAGTTSNVNLGSLTVVGLGDDSTADVTEDDGTVFSSQTLEGSIPNQIGLLVLTSAGDITNDPEAELLFNQAQFNADANNIFIGNQDEDRFASLTGSKVEVGFLAANVSIDSQSSLIINGLIPLIDNQVNDLDLTDNLGTQVAATLFIDSEGSVEQLLGSLDASQIGIMAGNQVRLELVSANNESLTATASDATAENNLSSSHQLVLNQLQAIEGSEVNADSIQSISVAHETELVISSVINPDAFGGVSELSGVSTMANDDGSILLIAEDLITFENNAAAEADNNLPQVTVYVRNSEPLSNSNDDASRVNFLNGAEISVSGNRGSEANVGVVNAPQVVAFFGTDTDDNGAIDTFFFDENQNQQFDVGETVFSTTTIISLDGSSTASQQIQAIYGNVGEVGYRLGFVFDSERRFDPAFDNSQEIPNLYTTNGSTLTEGFNIAIQAVADSAAQTSVDSQELSVQTAIVEQAGELDAGPFNFNSVFQKVEPFSLESLSARTDTPFLFTVVEVRNDQDINLFVGSEATNALNAVSDTLEATIETFGVEPFVHQVGFVEHNIPDILPPDRILDQTPVVSVVELPEVTTFEQTGELRFVAVKIDNPDSDEDDEKPELNFTEVDGELVLKDPLISYEPFDPDDAKELEGVTRNQYEEITAAIEADPKAEAGLWYKIYIDNENNADEDELLFYYYKIGKQQDADLGPESDFSSEDSAGQQQDTTDDSPVTQSDDYREMPAIFESRPKLSGALEQKVETLSGVEDSFELTTAGGLLASSVFVSAMTLAGGCYSSQVASADHSTENIHPDFSRLNQLKQELKELLSRR